MFHHRPIIGIVGGIGSGKSTVARLFGELGCLVIDSDKLVEDAYHQDDVKAAMFEWWGSSILKADGTVDRAEIAKRVFSKPQLRRQLEGLLHPKVAKMRDSLMESAGNDVVAFVWDTPLLVETGLDAKCDALVFVDTPDEVRCDRVVKTRGWTPQQWAQREKIQQPLDKKRRMAKYMVSNTAGTDQVRDQVRHVLSRIVAEGV